MTIRARFNSRCPKCGGFINVGDQVNWEKGQKATHATCPAAKTAAATPAARQRRTSAKQPELHPGEQYVDRASRSREDGYRVGATVHFGRIAGGGGPDGHYWTVTAAGKRRGNEDNQEFDAWVAWAHIRPATEEEAAPVAARITEAEQRKQMAETLVAELETSKHIEQGQDPRGQSVPAGSETIWSENRMGGSERWAVDAEGVVWYSQSSCDDWATWRTSATREQVEALKATGLYRPNLLTVAR